MLSTLITTAAIKVSHIMALLLRMAERVRMTAWEKRQETMMPVYWQVSPRMESGTPIQRKMGSQKRSTSALTARLTARLKKMERVQVSLTFVRPARSPVLGDQDGGRQADDAEEQISRLMSWAGVADGRNGVFAVAGVII